MLRTFEGERPVVAESAYVDERAVVIGDVRIEDEASVWPGVVLRGDHEPIVLREGANIQDNATLHEGADIGPYATVGHNAIVHGATVARRGLVGMGAIVLDGSEVGEGSIVGANSLVTEDTAIPESTLAVGSPAKVVKQIEDSYWTSAGDRYVELAKRHADASAIVDVEDCRPGPE